jgi:heme-degrading monooxygenase HmoA
MYYVIFQGTEKEGKAAVSEQYYNTLVPLVNNSPGFINETGFAAVHKERLTVLVATFEDEDALKRWRNEPTHVRIQGKAAQGIYEAYRIRVGPLLESVSQQAKQNEGEVEHCILLFYRNSFEGTPADSITSLIDTDPAANEISDELLDSSVYQGPRILWISAWKSEAAASRFEKLIPRTSGDEAKFILVKRDYSKVSRGDAPSETPGGKQRETAQGRE